VRPNAKRDNGFIGDFVNRLKIGNRTRFIEPKRMHALNRRREARRIARRKLSTRLKGEVRVGGSSTHRFKTRCGNVHKIAALIARRRQRGWGSGTHENPR
jgi:hypothetical protein